MYDIQFRFNQLIPGNFNINVIIVIPEQSYADIYNRWFLPVAPFFGEFETYRVFRLNFFEIS